jgi:hypothetical protein
MRRDGVMTYASGPIVATMEFAHDGNIAPEPDAVDAGTRNVRPKVERQVEAAPRAGAFML